MSLRSPTVALSLFTFDISPLRDVAQTSDCGTHCRLYSIISPLCGVALTPDCGIVNLFVPFRGVTSDTRLAFSSTLEFSGGLPPDFLFISHALLFYYLSALYKSVHMHHVCICYILCPNCLASTFIVLTWLVDLARC